VPTFSLFLFHMQKVHFSLSGSPSFWERKSEGSERKARRGGGGQASEASQTKNIFLGPPSPTLSSLPFCAGVRFSRDSIRPFNDRIKIGENRGLWTVYFHQCLSWVFLVTKAVVVCFLYFRLEEMYHGPSDLSILHCQVDWHTFLSKFTLIQINLAGITSIKSRHTSTTTDGME